MTSATKGGVEFTGPLSLACQVNLESRIASRVLWRVGSGTYASEQDVYDGVFLLPWREWFEPQQTIRVDVVAIRSPLKSLDFTTLRIKDAVCDKFRSVAGQRPSVDTKYPAVRIHAFLDAKRWTIYLDTSGEALFKRGYRETAGEAPLRENLAAGILMLAGWEPGVPLLDPMCGSGTFLAEAAMMTLGRAPGLRRRFGFENLKPFDPRALKRLKAEADARVLPARSLPIFGADGDPAMIDAAKRNLTALGLNGAVSLRCADVLDLSAPAPAGVLVANPPYGVRLGDEAQLKELYPRLGDLLKQRFAGWRAYFLSADADLPKRIGLAASKRTPLFNGSLECRLLEYRMMEGSLRRRRNKVES